MSSINSSKDAGIRNGFIILQIYKLTLDACFCVYIMLYCNNQTIEGYKYLSLIILYFIISICIWVLMIHLSILPRMCRAMISILS